MPFVHGKAASVWMDNVDASQFFNEAATEISVDTAETSTFQAGWKTFIEGVAGAKVAVKGFYDKVNDAYLATNIQDGGSVMTVIPGGSIPAAIGDQARLVLVHDVQFAETSPVGGAVLAAASYQGDTPVGFGWVLHSVAVTDSGTTTGAGRNDGAATSTGWTAHLHILAITGSPTSWTVKLQDSADGSSWADLAGGGFTATNVATGSAQRLRGATTTTTLRQWVRYVATVVGGTSPTITFGLAYSRN